MILTPTIAFIATATYSQSTAFPTMTPAYSINSTISAESRPGAENGECRLLGPFALVVQAALGALALLSLVYKRWRERPQRPLKIWAFDASKQVVGSALLHVANLLMSMLSSGQLTVKADDYQANPCSFYLLNLAIDVSRKPPTATNKAKDMEIDNNRYTHTRRTPTTINTCIPPHSSRQPSRINRIRKLRSSPKSKVVDQTIFHLLPWPFRNETLRLLHFPNLPLDHTRWRLGSTMDRRQRNGAGLLRHAILPCCDERITILHYR